MEGEWVLVWLVCMSITMFITRNNGKGPWRGCLLGFLFGPVAILIAILWTLPRTPSQLEKAGQRWRKKGGADGD